MEAGKGILNCPAWESIQALREQLERAVLPKLGNKHTDYIPETKRVIRQGVEKGLRRRDCDFRLFPMDPTSA